MLLINSADTSLLLSISAGYVAVLGVQPCNVSCTESGAKKRAISVVSDARGDRRACRNLEAAWGTTPD